MSARGRRGHGQSPGASPQFLWALLVIGAALIGGLAAAALVHVSLYVAVLVSVAAGGIAAFAATRWPGPPSELPDQSAEPGRLSGPRREPVPHGPAGPGPAGPAGPGAVRPRPPQSDGTALTRDQALQTPAETVVQLLPASPKAGAPWWDAATGTPPAPSSAARRAPAPDLSTYLASTLIAQCPNCGAFRLDFKGGRNGWDFRCESCRYTWSWQPGTSWPPVRVAPMRRRELPPSPPFAVPRLDTAVSNERHCRCTKETSAGGILAVWCSCSIAPIR